MPRLLTYNFVAHVGGGPSIAATDVLEVEAYSYLEITVPAGTPDTARMTVDVAADSGAQFLAILSSDYENVAYTVTDTGGTTHDLITLNGPHLLVGAGIIGQLGGAPAQMNFQNTGGDDAIITILVGRDATPSP